MHRQGNNRHIFIVWHGRCTLSIKMHSCSFICSPLHQWTVCTRYILLQYWQKKLNSHALGLHWSTVLSGNSHSLARASSGFIYYQTSCQRSKWKHYRHTRILWQSTDRCFPFGSYHTCISLLRSFSTTNPCLATGDTSSCTCCCTEDCGSLGAWQICSCTSVRQYNLPLSCVRLWIQKEHNSLCLHSIRPCRVGVPFAFVVHRLGHN